MIHFLLTDCYYFSVLVILIKGFNAARLAIIYPVIGLKPYRFQTKSVQVQEFIPIELDNRLLVFHKHVWLLADGSNSVLTSSGFAYLTIAPYVREAVAVFIIALFILFSRDLLVKPLGLGQNRIC